jgi:uncharacterized protein (DUF1015 family)
MDDYVAERILKKPDIDFTAKDGVRHSSWKLSNEQEIHQIEKLFARLPCLYIADGHHRSAAAARVFESRKGAGQSAHFLAVIFPHSQMQILPYNRVLKDPNGKTPEQLLELLKTQSLFVPGSHAGFSESGRPTPSKKHEVSFYFQRKWWTFSIAPMKLAKKVAENLDVTLLQKKILAPIFGIDDPRTSNRIAFVGGIRGPAELEKLVDSGEYACAFSMFPTGIEDLMDIADAGGIMPPKSTWFEPKLRDAMFCHLI